MPETNFRIEDALPRAYRTLTPWSDIYTFDFRRFLNSLKILEREAGPLAGKKVLDLGSGIGLMIKTLNLLGAEAMGVDKLVFSSEPASIYSVKNFEKLETLWRENGIKVFKSDLAFENLPFGDESFDVAICDATIEHLPVAPKHLFSEARRILRKDGLFLVTTPNIASLWKRIRFLLLGRSPNWDLKDYFENWNNFRGHSREFTKKELREMLEWSGFKIISLETKNVFRNEKRFFSKNPQKVMSQVFEFLSAPFPGARDTIYALAKPATIK
ncbi:class I SAM-dependent methyltransferase [Candidatus Giovannonibacteria bacterium]|nr:class I SAM-dependent methyltransferase [Candidatus Giovannonibacteria bacterium]